MLAGKRECLGKNCSEYSSVQLSFAESVLQKGPLVYQGGKMRTEAGACVATGDSHSYYLLMT